VSLTAHLSYPRPPRSDREGRKLIADALREWRRQLRAQLREARLNPRPRVLVGR
jgi:hypothetical protein